VETVQPTEKDWQKQVIDLAHLMGWTVAHFRPARTVHGWRTPVAADGAGFPDLVLVRGEELLFVELKAERGRLRPEQKQWIEKLSRAAETHVWKPADWDDVLQRLSHKGLSL
jgi:hypothetical protein